MNSIWFHIEDSAETESLNSIYLGSFKKDPVEIGISLVRPITPFQPVSSFPARLTTIKSKSGLLYSNTEIFSGHLHEFDQIIEPSVHSIRDSNCNYQLNLVPV